MNQAAGADSLEIGKEAAQVLLAALKSPDSIFPIFSYGLETYADLDKLREAGIFRGTTFGLALSENAKKSGAKFLLDGGALLAGASVPVSISLAGVTVTVAA